MAAIGQKRTFTRGRINRTQRRFRALLGSSIRANLGAVKRIQFPVTALAHTNMFGPGDSTLLGLYFFFAADSRHQTSGALANRLAT